MTRRSRILAFGAAAALVVAGVACAASIDGILGRALAIALLSAGLGGGLLLAFYEVGLSEDRERARVEQRRRKRAPKHIDRTPPWRRRRPRRPG